MEKKLEGKVAAVTGGTRGIGRAIAERFVAEGAKVVINSRNDEKGQRALDEMNAGEDVLFYPGSVTEKEVLEGFVDFTVENFGQLDIMVLNAGGVGDTAPVVDLSDEEWHLELDFNLNHVFRGTRKALWHMVPRKTGRIIAISSIEGKRGKANIAGYTANKHAINGFVKSAAKEVGTEGITINSICPGLVHTDMLENQSGAASGLTEVADVIALYTKDTAIQRPVTVDEIAAFALLLASEEGAGFSGGTISLDGGLATY